MDTLFEQLAAMGDRRDQLTSRLRFMIKDVLDLRKDNWVARRQLVCSLSLYVACSFLSQCYLLLLSSCALSHTHTQTHTTTTTTTNKQSRNRNTKHKTHKI